MESGSKNIAKQKDAGRENWGHHVVQLGSARQHVFQLLKMRYGLGGKKGSEVHAGEERSSRLPTGNERGGRLLLGGP